MNEACLHIHNGFCINDIPCSANSYDVICITSPFTTTKITTTSTATTITTTSITTTTTTTISYANISITTTVNAWNAWNEWSICQLHRQRNNSIFSNGIEYQVISVSCSLVCKFMRKEITKNLFSCYSIPFLRSAR